MMEKCNQCDCCEYEGCQKDKNICLCGHSKESHVGIVIPNTIQAEIRNSLKDLRLYKQKIKTEIDHMDMIICRLERRFEVNGEGK